MPLVQINPEIGPAAVSSGLGRVLAGRQWNPISMRAGMPWDRALAAQSKWKPELPFFASPEAYVLVFESDSGRLSIVTETRRFTRWTITRIAQNVKGTSLEYKA